MVTDPRADKPQGIFGVPLNVSIKYANVAISLTNDNGESFIYGYVPIVVAKCGVFLKEKGMCVTSIRSVPLSDLGEQRPTSKGFSVSTVRPNASRISKRSSTLLNAMEKAWIGMDIPYMMPQMSSVAT